MSLILHYHPISSFCWKALIALYENDTPFMPNVVDLGDEAQRAALLKLWPIGKFPVLEDRRRDRVVPEASIIIEYLAQHHPGPSMLVPADPDVARQMRLRDRFFDNYVHHQLQKIVADSFRPAGQHDEIGLAQARAQLDTSYAMIEADMAAKAWAMGDAFTMADCAAFPALYYAHVMHPIGKAQTHTLKYLKRLMARASVVRTLEQAEPMFAMFPFNEQRKAMLEAL